MEQYLGMTLAEMEEVGADIEITMGFDGYNYGRCAMCLYEGVWYDLYFGGYATEHFDEPLTQYSPLV